MLERQDVSIVKQSPRQLDRWHKVEERSGITRFWPVVSYVTVQRLPRIRTVPSNKPITVFQSTSPANDFYRNQQTSAIWSASYPTRPAVSVRKPRARRLLRNLMCCFGAKPIESPVPLSPTLAGDHYSPKNEKFLLPPIRPSDVNKKCLIVDLDETLVHSSFKPVKNPDFIIPVEIDGVVHQVYVLKRPYVDEFLQRIGRLYECVLFTASLAKYADPVADLLDRWGVFRTRLFREACVFNKGNYVKDLNRLGRDLKRVLIIDNSPASYAFHPENAIPVQSWFDDTSDAELIQILPFMERLAKVDNIYPMLRTWNASRTPTASQNGGQAMMNNENGGFVLDRAYPSHLR